MRYRITSMMAAILIIALCLAALRINSILWAGALFFANLALLCGATFMALTEKDRLSWLGYAVFGWPCFLVGFGPMVNERMGPVRTTAIFEEAIPNVNPPLH